PVGALLVGALGAGERAPVDERLGDLAGLDRPRDRDEGRAPRQEDAEEGGLPALEVAGEAALRRLGERALRDPPRAWSSSSGHASHPTPDRAAMALRR